MKRPARRVVAVAGSQPAAGLYIQTLRLCRRPAAAGLPPAGRSEPRAPGPAGHKGPAFTTCNAGVRNPH